MNHSIKRINPPTLPNPDDMGYSQISIIEPGRMAYVSSLTAWCDDNQAIPAGLVEQTKLATQNVKAALDALKATPHDIAILRCYFTDLTPERLNQAFPVLLEMLDGAEPSLSGFGVAALALPDLQIELEITVRIPDEPTY